MIEIGPHFGSIIIRICTADDGKRKEENKMKAKPDDGIEKKKRGG